MLTILQVAERLGAGESSVRIWCAEGRFPNAKHYGKMWLIPDTDLKGFIKRDPGRPPKKKDDEKSTPAKKQTSKKS